MQNDSNKQKNARINNKGHQFRNVPTAMSVLYESDKSIYMNTPAINAQNTLGIPVPSALTPSIVTKFPKSTYAIIADNIATAITTLMLSNGLTTIEKPRRAIIIVVNQFQCE